jgi:hypothetical protein
MRKLLCEEEVAFPMIVAGAIRASLLAGAMRARFS